MSDEFPIVVVTQEAYEFSQDEAMGSKYKFWFDHEDLGRCLYKQARQNTGEDWAEKIAAELCELLGLPHARYELATTWEGGYGTVSPSFVSEGGTLVHGNEILAPIVPNYPQSESRGVSQHTIDIVLKAIGDDCVNLPIGWTLPVGIQTAVDTFVGYLLLDAWIGNTDRHHENWAFLRNKTASTSRETVYLAPTYDHSSCLGRELLDQKRQEKFNNCSVEAYVNRCRSALYASINDTRPLKTFDAFCEVARRHPEAAKVWLARLASVSATDTLALFKRIPSNRISPIAVEFAQKILELNQRKLLDMMEVLS